MKKILHTTRSSTCRTWIKSGVVRLTQSIPKEDFLHFLSTETMRLQSPETHLSRMCTEAVEVNLPKGKKLLFEKNSVVLIPIISLHLDPEFYPNPKEFNPDRFSPENGGVKAYIQRGVFLPFGLGPRTCVGNRFGVAQSKAAITALIKNFEISVNPKSPPQLFLHPQTMISSLVGCCLDFKEIK